MLNFVQHRDALFSKMADNTLAVVPSADVLLRNRDADFPFRQSSDFFYLSGFTEDSACLLLQKKQGQCKTILFCQPKVKEMEIWTGYRLGQDAAIDQLQVDEAFAIEELVKQLPDFMGDCEQVYAAWGHSKAWDAKLINAIEQVKLKSRLGIQAPTAMQAIEPLLHELRLFKGEAEIELMAKAASISAHGHIAAMQRVKPGMYEYQLEGTIRQHCAEHGSRFDAYTSIVGSGANACILHYTANDQAIKDGDLILIDAGCELNHYASDITRTFPANGRFNPEQKALYELVLKSQFAAIDAVKPGNHFNSPHEVVLRILTEGLVELGLLSGDVDTLIKEEAFKPFYMHRTSHWLGMDVHDVGAYKQDGNWRKLEPGMVLTIEPGLYIAPDDESVDEKWRGIGIRIEDDVLVTSDGHRVLSHEVPKTVADIEALMAQAS
ncbi:Xaa-Pro aminopeptidase [Oceaniserpentilla sp. 4NH20-0058]|uniref:Xaa-Pro aminopeptidase n=1 Tax=Oceaniserpentilla sp. 4NH20-0058 TaxID=3127660 RepID=UPI003105645E